MDSGIKKSNIIDSNKVLPASFGKVFGAKIVDCFILILFSFAIFFGICFPILQNSSYVQLIDNKDKASKLKKDESIGAGIFKYPSLILEPVEFSETQFLLVVEK